MIFDPKTAVSAASCSTAPRVFEKSQNIYCFLSYDSANVIVHSHQQVSQTARTCGKLIVLNSNSKIKYFKKYRNP